MVFIYKDRSWTGSESTNRGGKPPVLVLFAENLLLFNNIQNYIIEVAILSHVFYLEGGKAGTVNKTG